MTDLKIIEDFVRNSNWIEGIYEHNENDPEWDNHIDIAIKIEEESAKQIILHPTRIHTTLMKKLVECPGEYRRIQVYVGNDRTTQPIGPAIIDIAMQNWFDCLKQDIKFMHENKDNVAVASVAWQYHHWFESIHPFIDGNGRTGRLILNNIRRSFGLPWLIIVGTPPGSLHLIEEHRKYYEFIREWRKENKNLLSTKRFF